MKELHPDILNDYEHTVLRAIDRFSESDGFPSMVEHAIERKIVEDYLYEYQRILDSPGSQKAQLTKYGIIAVIPILIFSAFPENMLPWGKWSLIVGIMIGLAIALLLKVLSMLRVRMALRQLRRDNPVPATYVDLVNDFTNKINMSNQ